MNSNQYHFNNIYRKRYSTTLFLRRCYSTASNLDPPIPILTINNLQNKRSVLCKRDVLYNKGGIYSFVNNVNGKQYIGSAKNLFVRLKEHLCNRKSNSALQQAILKYGLENFSFCVYEYFLYENKLASSKLLTDLESIYIKKFNFTSLYNFMKNATSLEGYKHTDAAKLKMVNRFSIKSNHPLWGKHHNEKTKLLISKPGIMNPMFGKTHTEQTKNLIRIKMKKYDNGVGIYDLNENLIKSFDYATDLAKYLNITKVTVSKYINKGLVYKGIYYFKVKPTP